MYLPDLRNSTADAHSRQPGKVGWPDDNDIEDYGSGICELQHTIVFTAVEDWLQVVVPHLFQTGCIEAMKTVLSSCCPVVALARKRCSRKC